MKVNVNVKDLNFVGLVPTELFLSLYSPLLKKPTVRTKCKSR